MDERPDVTTRYDDGYFDKDEQGWCSHNVEITQIGERVILHRWGDDNGARPYDEHREGTIAKVLVDRGLVLFAGGLAGWVFDLRTRRAAVRSWVVREFSPPIDYLDIEFRARAMQLVLDVAASLGEPVRSAGLPEPWPAPLPSTTCQGATESRMEAALANGGVLSSLLRTLDDGTMQLLLELRDGKELVQLFIWTADRGHVLFGGPIEREPDADAVIARWREDLLATR